jgi:hypothetical protein
MSGSFVVRGRQLALLLRNEFLSQSRPVLVTAAAAFALLAVSWIVNVAIGQAGDFYPFFFGATMVVGGVVLASRAFAELHDPLRCTAYLTLPASLPEKYLSKLLLTSVGYAAAVTAFFYVFSFTAWLAARLVFGLSMPVFGLSRGGTLRALVVFLTLHPVFFFGSLYFKRLALAKTLLSVLSFVILLGALAAAVGWSLVRGVDGAIAMHNIGSNVAAVLRAHGPALSIAARVMAWGVLPMFFLGLAYLRLTEHEVQDGL